MTPFAIRKRLRALVEKRLAPASSAPAPTVAHAPAVVTAPPAKKERSWELSTQAELVDHIVSHFHEGLRRDLPVLVDAAMRLEREQAQHPQVPAGLADTLATMSSELQGHMLKEENVLFPILRRGARGGVDMPIRMMQRDHEEHDANLERIRALTANLTAPADASVAWKKLYADLVTFETELHQHIYLEDNILFARAAGGTGD